MADRARLQRLIYVNDITWRDAAYLHVLFSCSLAKPTCILLSQTEATNDLGSLAKKTRLIDIKGKTCT